MGYEISRKQGKLIHGSPPRDEVNPLARRGRVVCVLWWSYNLSYLAIVPITDEDYGLIRPVRSSNLVWDSYQSMGLMRSRRLPSIR